MFSKKSFQQGVAAAVGAAALVLCAGVSGARAQNLTGAGATFPAPLYQRWFQVYGQQNGVQINYQPIGSGGGIKAITAKSVDFGASDAPMNAQELAAAPDIVHIPTVAGAVVVAYNLPGVKSGLKLTGDVIADIFLGNIAKWNDPKIAKLNPGVTLPGTNVAPFHRSDGSGTTNIFTTYLAEVSGAWKSDIGAGKSVRWTKGLGGKGNPGVAQLIKQNEGGVGYIELNYAVKNDITYADVKNAAGKFITPTVESTTQAAQGATLPADFRKVITNTSDPEGYPITGFTFLLVYPNAKPELKKFLQWALTDGQKEAPGLYYAPLPKNVQQKALAAVGKIHQVLHDTISGAGSSAPEISFPLEDDEAFMPDPFENVAEAALHRGAATVTASDFAGPRGSIPTTSSSAARIGDQIYASLIFLASLSIFGIIFALAWNLTNASWQSIQTFGTKFVTGAIWDETTSTYGILPFIFGTLYSSFLALLLAVPVSLGAAIFLSELAPRWIRTPVTFLIELLAAIPSVVYGIWGIFILLPWLKTHVMKPLTESPIEKVPLLGSLFSGAAIGPSMLAAGIILAIMIIPFITAVSRDILRAIPRSQREGSYALGATWWETMGQVVIPYARSGIVGAVILGLGRALGETMAVTMVIGNQAPVTKSGISWALFEPGYTMASALANKFNEASPGISTAALVEIGLVLFVVTVIVNIAARLLVYYTAKDVQGRK